MHKGNGTVSDTKPDLSTLYFRNRHLLVLTIIILLIAGLGSFANLPRLEDPRITTRDATILTFLPGASAERVEALINEKIEDVLEEIDDIKTIKSTARAGVSSISIELKASVTTETNQSIFAKIRSRLQNVQNQLPTNASMPFLDDLRGATAYTLILGVSWNGNEPPPMNLMQRVALDFKDRYLNNSNTELVRIFGGVEEEILVTPNKEELSALNLSVERLAQRISQADSKVSAGQLRTSYQDLQFEVAGALNSVDRVMQIPLRTNEFGTVLKVGDIATVERSYQTPVQQLGWHEGKRTLYIAIRADDTIRVDRWMDGQRYDDLRRAAF